jgi:Icc protein
MRILHLSDFHLSNDSLEILYGINSYAHLSFALEAVRTLRPQPDLVVVGGDVFHDGEKGDYGILQEIFSALAQPVHLVMGNHDRLEAYKRTAQPSPAADFPGYASFNVKGYHMVLLYSSGTGAGYGELDEAQLQWLENDLAHSHPLPALVFMHHPPVTVGVPWLDRINLLNGDDFWGVVDRYKGRLCGVFVSHVHLQMSCFCHGVLVASCPSIGWQFSANANAAKTEMSGEWPGFNVIDLAKDRVCVRTVRFEV